MNAPWFKFYPSDWRADPALRMCSPAARGLWIEMLCLMHEAEPRGSLLINGQAITEKQLSSLTGIAVRHVTACLTELETAGVFSREDNRTVYSRRMRRDDAKAKRDKANGRGGGNPSLKGGVNPQDNGEDKAQIPDTRYQIPKRKKQEDTADAVTSAKSYAFESGVIRLTQKDFDQWVRCFSHLDVGAELIGLTEWAGQQGQKWFQAVSGALAKRNREIAASIERNGKFKPMSGIDGVI